MYTLSHILPFIDLTTGLIGTLVTLLLYVGFSLGLFLAGRSVGLKSAWLAWFPFLRLYVLGAIMDRTLRAPKGKKSVHGIMILLVALLKEIVFKLYSSLSLAFIWSVLGGYFSTMFLTIGSIEQWYSIDTGFDYVEIGLGSTGIQIENIPPFIPGALIVNN